MSSDMTQEEVTRQYNAAMDSVAMLLGDKPSGMSDADWEDCIKRNIEHLKIVMSRDYMKDQDLTPIHNAIKKHEK
jgi:hypothetical protein